MHDLLKKLFRILPLTNWYENRNMLVGIIITIVTSLQLIIYGEHTDSLIDNKKEIKYSKSFWNY